MESSSRVQGSTPSATRSEPHVPVRGPAPTEIPRAAGETSGGRVRLADWGFVAACALSLAVYLASSASLRSLVTATHEAIVKLGGLTPEP